MKAAVFDQTQENIALFVPNVPVPDVTSRHALIDIKAAGLK